MSVPANDLAWDATHALIYLSVPSAFGPNGNTIVAVDPVTGATVATQFAGSEPDKLSISADDQYLYVSLDGSASVQRFLLPSLTPDISYSLGRNSLDGPYSALDLQVAPGASHTSAVSLGTPGFSPAANGGITIFDDATPRPTATPGFIGGGLYDSIQWGATSSVMYAANTEVDSFDFYTLAVSANGVQLTRDFPYAFGSFTNRIHYDSGTNLVYSDEGIVLNPTTGSSAGTYAALGPMVPDSSTNTVYFAVGSGGSYAIESFNQSHFTPLSTTTLTNVSYSPLHLIRWGTQGLAFNTSGGPVYLTGSSGSTTGTQQGGVPLGSASVLTVSQAANDIAWDNTHGVIYASVPSTGSTNGNSIVAINPTTGAITASQFAGSEPTILAISDDDQYLYVGLNGSSSVQRFVLPGLTPDINFSLGSGTLGAYYALDLQVAPGAPHSIAITRANTDVTPAADGGIVIYDDATARSVIAAGFGPGGGSLYDSLQWGHDATTLYASNDEDTGFDFYTLAVNTSGVQPSHDYGYVFPTFYGRIHYDQTTGLVYDDDGYTASPATGLPAGIFGASGVMIPDGTLNSAFFLGTLQTGSSDYVIESFDLTHYTPTAYFPVSGVSGTPTRIIRWGSNGLAFCAGSAVYIVSGSFVNNPTVPQTMTSARLQGSVHRTWVGPGGKLLPTQEDLQQRMLKAQKAAAVSR